MSKWRENEDVVRPLLCDLFPAVRGTGGAAGQDYRGAGHGAHAARPGLGGARGLHRLRRHAARRPILPV